MGFDTSGVDIPYSYILLLLYSPSRLKIDSNAKLESEDEHEHEHETKIEDKAKPISLPELEPESKPKSKPESGSDLELKPHPKLLTLRTLQTSHPLTPRQTLLLDLHLGSYFSQLHTNIQNDWFGLPKHEKEEGRYSWQETFVGLLEDVLGELEGRTSDMTEGGGGGEEVVIPFGDIRKYLSRAIGFFLFDDCEVPSLVSFLGDEDSILVLVDSDSLSNSKGITQQEDENTKVEKVGDVIEEGKEGKEEEEEEVKILSALPVSHALWGDPLLETIFLNNPSKAFLEGYGKPKLFVFPRQKTKRMWYTLFLGLVVLVQARRDQENYHSSDDDDDDEGGEWRKEKKKWAKEMVAKCVEELKDAPCY